MIACGAFHHTLLLTPQLNVCEPEGQTAANIAAIPDPPASTTSCTTTTKTKDSGTILLQVVLLRVVGPNGMAVTTYAMLDSRSELTLVDP